MSVRMFRPKTLTKAYSLAKLQEIIVETLSNQPKPLIRTPQMPMNPRPIVPNATTNNPMPKQATSSRLLPTPNGPRLPQPYPTKIATSIFDKKKAKGLFF